MYIYIYISRFLCVPAIAFVCLPYLSYFQCSRYYIILPFALFAFIAIVAAAIM